nr:DJ-1/PfpI family protein [uncultured Pseudomonas sp.]
MGFLRLGVTGTLATIQCLIAGITLAQPLSIDSGDSSTQRILPYPPAANMAKPRQLPTTQKTKKIGIVIFPGFESMDVFGPAQMWGRLPEYELVLISEHGGPVMSAQGISTLASYSFGNAPRVQIMMIPGGKGSRDEVRNQAMLDFVRDQDQTTKWTVSVSAGAAILAKSGVLKGRNATSNKLAFKFATSQDAQVRWQGNARWVVDGKYVTASGGSAGTDMALDLIERLYGRSYADRTARIAEYTWNDQAANGQFDAPAPSTN